MNDRDNLVGSAWAIAIIQLGMCVNGARILRNVVSGFNQRKESCQSSSSNIDKGSKDNPF